MHRRPALRAAIAGVLALFVSAWLIVPARGQAPAFVHFVFTSDAHYGLTRPTFRGLVGVDAREVNRALVESVNRLAEISLPDDGGLGAATRVGGLEFLAEGGDIANRMEFDSNGRQIQSAAVSIAQFKADYTDGLTAKDNAGVRTPVFAVPGNHDATNAVGFYRPLTPPIDPTAMIELFNRMTAPRAPRTPETFDYRRDQVRYTRDIGGIHFVFISVWPDSQARAWMDEELRRVPATTPVVVVTHDEPNVEAKHFVNPKAPHDVNATDRFENLLADEFRDWEVTAESVAEQRHLEEFLRRHPNVTAYFHGNSNWNQFYDYVGPDHTAALHVFRADSPMKGRFSNADETKLSFQLATFDPLSRRLTVREVLWNAYRTAGPPVWGASTTVSLAPRPRSYWPEDRRWAHGTQGTRSTTDCPEVSVPAARVADLVPNFAEPNPRIYQPTREMNQ